LFLAWLLFFQGGWLTVTAAAVTWTVVRTAAATAAAATAIAQRQHQLHGSNINGVKRSKHWQNKKRRDSDMEAFYWRLRGENHPEVLKLHFPAADSGENVAGKTALAVSQQIKPNYSLQANLFPNC